MNVLDAGRPPRHRRGSALILALFAVISIAGLTLGLLSVGVASTREHNQRNDNERSLYLAEAALAEAVTALRTGGTGGIASAGLPALYGDGILWVEATPIDAKLTRLTVAAACGSGRTALEVVVDEQGPALFPGALACNGQVNLNRSILIDSYNPALGSYADQLAALFPQPYVGDKAIVASNADLKLNNDSTIYGDARPGPTFIVDLMNGAVVTGSTAPAAEVFVYEPITAPVLPPGGALNVPNGATVTIPAGDHRFSEIDLGVNSILIIEGPSTIVVDGRWDMGPSGTMILGSPDNAIEIYAMGDLKWGPGCVINTPGEDPALLSVYALGDAQTMCNLGASSKFTGTFYAPQTSKVSLSAGFEIFGALAANTLAVNNNSKIHFDERLVRPASGPGSAPFARRSWHYTDFPDSVLKGNTGDPFVLLGVNRADLPKPSDAHN